MRKLISRTTSLAICLFIAAVVLAASVGCGGPAGTTAPTAVSGPTATPVAKADWQTEWDKTVTEAKKEGKLVSYSLWSPQQRDAVGPAFRQKYGIEIEFVPFQRGAEMVTKLQAERTAGLNLADVFGAGGSTPITLLKPENLCGPVEPLLILPEAKDPKYWSGDRFPWLDKDKMVIGMVANLSRDFLYNTSLVKKGELSSYEDLLKPQYKGKMTLNDPTMAGASNVMMSFLVRYAWNQEKALDYLTKLVKDQEVVIQTDLRLHVETVARGKYSIGIGPHAAMVAEFLGAGAPIDVVADLKEGTMVTYGTGAMAVSARIAHPNATKVFVNWLLTKEGQSLFARGYGQPSLRLDASTEGISPIYLPQRGERFFYESEEDTIFRAQLNPLIKRTIDEARK